jgi:hypothetical protein
MAKKKDPSVTYLNKFGYNVVKLPRAGIEPLDVIGRDETTQWLGPLPIVWKSNVGVPAPSAPRPAVAINGQRSDSMDIKFGMKILANALAAFGASVPSLDIAYRRARKVQFSFANVTSVAVSPLEAGEYLAAGTLSTDNPVVKHYFNDPESEAYLILEVLKSDSITATATDEHGVDVGVDVPVINQVLGAKVEAKTTGASSSTITYTAKDGPPVTFGFIVDAIEYDGKQWSISGKAPGGILSFPAVAGGAAVAPETAPILLSPGCFVRV